MALETLYSVKSAAERLGMSAWTFYAWLSCGRLKGVRIGRRVLIRESELERLIQDTVKPRRSD